MIVTDFAHLVYKVYFVSLQRVHKDKIMNTGLVRGILVQGISSTLPPAVIISNLFTRSRLLYNIFICV